MYIALANTVVILLYTCVGVIAIHNVYLLHSIIRATRALHKHDPHVFYLPDQDLLKQPLLRVGLPQYIINVALRLSHMREKQGGNGGAGDAEAASHTCASSTTTTHSAHNRVDAGEAERANHTGLTHSPAGVHVGEQHHGDDHARVVFSPRSPCERNEYDDTAALYADNGSDALSQHDGLMVRMHHEEVEKEKQYKHAAPKGSPRTRGHHTGFVVGHDHDTASAELCSLQPSHHNRTSDTHHSPSLPYTNRTTITVLCSM